jgi:uncharacterized protein YqiB (DUF1249 family)
MALTDYRINLADQQAECALNYARLLRLLPQLLAEDSWLLILPAAEQMAFTVIERGPYTTTLRMVHQQERSWARSESDCVVRVYHDAQMAEVVAFQGQWRIQPCNDYPNPAMHQIDEKAQLNNFLGEWLSHCLQHGYLQRDVSSVLNVDSRS